MDSMLRTDSGSWAREAHIHSTCSTLHCFGGIGAAMLILPIG
jgi:hypothetical protein